MALIFGPTSWQLGVRIAATALGSSFGGGRLICKSGGVAWIVALSTAEVSRTWYCRNDAVPTAQSCTGCTGWFVPTFGQLQNPGWSCRTYWDSYATRYWSNTENGVSAADGVCFTYGGQYNTLKTCTLCTRAFRCVTY